jgi:hypothetical protein
MVMMAGVILKWKTSPPCRANINLVRLFKENKVKSDDTESELPNFGILIPNSRSLVSLRSEDTLISKKRLMVDKLKLDLKLYTSFLGRSIY